MSEKVRGWEELFPTQSTMGESELPRLEENVEKRLLTTGVVPHWLLLPP